LKYKIALLALWMTSLHVVAAELPSAGSQLQQIPQSPAPQKPPPEIRIEQDGHESVAASNDTKIVVSAITVKNARRFSQRQLSSVIGFQPDSEQTLSSLRGMAAKIAVYYHRHGYFLAQATIPAQDVHDGVVVIEVIEGTYGKVVVRNRTRLAASIPIRLVAGLNPGDTVAIAPLETRLLLLSDLPGVAVRSTLTPSVSPRASDLVVDVSPGPLFSGSVDADNAGNRYTGTYRTGATLNINDPFGLGDLASLRALTSWDGLNYVRGAYQMQVDRADVGVAYTALDYKLGDEFESLEAHGTAEIASVYGKYPLIRTRSENLYLQLGVDVKSFHDKVDASDPATSSDKRATVGMLSLIGDFRDHIWGGASSTYSFTWNSGDLDLLSAQAVSTDATTARTNGHYDKFDVSATRLQTLSGPLSLYVALQGQVATKNLDVSEKMGLGGSEAVRSYPEGEAYVDQGYILNLEARLSLPALNARVPGQWQSIAFLDTGTGSLNKDDWGGVGQNRRTLSGAGLGLNWFGPEGIIVKADYAHKLGAAAATSAPDADSRFWIHAVKYF
jgi:hemolysin activation/secretion protein